MPRIAAIDAGPERSHPSEATSGVPPSRNGHALRRQRTHDMIIKACQTLMIAGMVQPDTRSLARRCGVSNRTVFIHFPTLRDLYREALKDAEVTSAIERRVPHDRPGILRAVVLGELMPPAVRR